MPAAHAAGQRWLAVFSIVVAMDSAVEALVLSSALAASVFDVVAVTLHSQNNECHRLISTSEECMVPVFYGFGGQILNHFSRIHFGLLRSNN
ncbi:hypothetical protein SynBIOSU31_00861 [Synechococcus sp. BIOS-U3-1]|uniref:hypothetical protein n=1 Tax=Synechococcus sp. BIOS-U3-1 TaxID=1400865 RepID=UPI0016475079|nr:hypothetical protein [Synechococcus sp. BIOS-U3-1]QNI57748.1 hypothetical protein SynBIOSU31_00861 [Synechococcus sp. BIOS-U3-1]